MRGPDLQREEAIMYGGCFYGEQRYPEVYMQNIQIQISRKLIPQYDDISRRHCELSTDLWTVK